MIQMSDDTKKLVSLDGFKKDTWDKYLQLKATANKAVFEQDFARLQAVRKEINEVANFLSHRSDAFRELADEIPSDKFLKGEE